jgi:S1-C subfamily serine protease
MEALIKDGHVTRGYLGVEQRDLTPEIAQTLKLPIQHGVLITGVLQSGPASAGGLRPGDVVVRVADTPVSNPAQMLNVVAALKPQQVTAIGVQRGDQALELKVTIGQRPKLRRQE